MYLWCWNYAAAIGNQRVKTVRQTRIAALGITGREATRARRVIALSLWLFMVPLVLSRTRERRKDWSAPQIGRLRKQVNSRAEHTKWRQPWSVSSLELSCCWTMLACARSKTRFQLDVKPGSRWTRQSRHRQWSTTSTTTTSWRPLIKFLCLSTAYLAPQFFLFNKFTVFLWEAESTTFLEPTFRMADGSA